MGRISTCAALVAMLLMLGCAATAGDLPAPIPDATQETDARTEAVPTPFESESLSSNRSRSLESFGHCVGHYSREIEYLPNNLPFEETNLNFSSKFDREAKQWMSIGLCLDFTPRPQVDDVSGKCLIAAVQWYAGEYPESEALAPAVAAVACLPAYSPNN